MFAGIITLKLSCNYQRSDPHAPLNCKSVSTNSAKFNAQSKLSGHHEVEDLYNTQFVLRDCRTTYVT
jgi:hypothetical protein